MVEEVVSYTSCLMRGANPEDSESQQKRILKKLEKKFLTNSTRCDRIKKLPNTRVKRAAKTVPCKLNNPKTNKTPWTIIMDCLSDDKSKLTANENS